MPQRAANLLQAATQVLHAQDEAEALQVIAQAVHADGWHSVIVHSYDDDWRIAHAAYVNISDEDRQALDTRAMTAEERAATFGPAYEPYRISRSYFFPAEQPGALTVIRTMHLPCSEGQAPGSWRPDDAAYIPMRCAENKIIGRITIDGPLDGNRPDQKAFEKLEAFADLAALGISRLRARARQREAEHTVSAMMNAVGSLIWLTYDDDRPPYFNEEWYRFTGGSPEDEVSHAFSQHCHPDDLPETRRSFRAAVAARAPWAGEYRLRKHDGDFAWMLERARPLFSSNGDYIGHVCTAVDISAEHHAKEELERERDRLAMAIDASGGGHWEAEYTGKEPPNSKPIRRTFDQRLLDIVGYAQSDFPGGHGWDRIVHPDDKAVKAQQDRLDSVDHVERRIREYRVLHKDGSVRWVRSSYLTRSTHDGLPLRQVGFVMDITDQKRAEQELRRERDRLAIALMAAGAGLWEGTFPNGASQKHGEILYVSPRISEIAGYPTGWPASHDDWDAIVHPDDKVAKEAQDAQHIKGNLPHVSREYRIRHKDGSTRWVRTAYITTDDHGRPGQTVGVVLDITEQKRIEQTLHRERDRLALAIEASGGAFWESEPARPGSDKQGAILHHSSRMGEIAGYANGVWPRSHDEWDAIVLPEDQVIKDQQDAAHRRGELPHVAREYRIRHRDGSIRWVRSCYLSSAASGEPRSVGFIMDITNERLAAQRLQRERDRLALAVEASGGGFADAEWSGETLANPSTVKLTTISNRICELLGYSQDEIKTAAAFRNLIHPEDRARNDQQDQQYFVSDLPRITRETRFICKDGTIRWLRARFLTRRDSKGRPVYSMSFMLDITEQKRVEEELRRQSAFFQAVVRSIPEAIIITSTDRRIIAANHAFTHMYGYSEQEALGRTAQFLYADKGEFVRQGHLRYNINAPITIEPYETEYVRADGSTVPSESVGGPVKDSDGATIAFIGVHRDVTARKESEQRMRELLERERFLVAELDHRVRNALGGLLSLIDLTASTSEGAQACAATLSSRVRSMVTAYDLMSATRWRPIELTELVQRLLPAGAPGTLVVDGVPARIPARQATAFAMIVNELMANSLKYGALGAPSGTARVTWQLQQGQLAGECASRLVMQWIESGGPSPHPNPGPGLGTELIAGFAR